MHLSQIVTFLASGAALAAAFPTERVKIGIDDVVMYGSGRYMLMKMKDIPEMEHWRKNGSAPPMPGYLNDKLFHGPGNETLLANGTLPMNGTHPSINGTHPSTNRTESIHSILAKRARWSSVIVPLPHQRFLGWDVQMSSIVKGAPTAISLESGIEISNEISIGVEASFSLISDFLEASISVDYTHSWTTSSTQSFDVEVPAGKYGALVSNAWTDRESGHIFQGVIGTEGEWIYYEADSYTTKKYNDMSWVDGVIALCTGDTFPLPRCIGEGTL